ncbi:MAG TPA: DUF896 domain-containing protein [Bacillales bacterium]|nr:DUF896 domain-containing protein [Bacillales bacterium]
MLSDDKLKRINELARKAKSDGLTKQEKKEQKELRQQYLQRFRESFKNQLHSVKVIDPEGNDVTPEKLKNHKRNDS